MDQKKSVYKVFVDTGGSANVFETYDNRFYENVRRGNEDMFFFETVDGDKVAIPTRFMVTIKRISGE